MNIKEMLLNGKNDAIVHGRAGSGKSTLIRSIANEYDGNVLVMAPTGIAAENVGGVTLDSKLYPNIVGEMKKAKRFSLFDLIIIDEISMIHSYKLGKLMQIISLCERFYDKKIRLIMVGDIHQLPPVVTDDYLKASRKLYKNNNLSLDDFFFFQSEWFRRRFEEDDIDCYQLTSSYRQQDEKIFRDLLDKIALCKLNQAEIDMINSRVVHKSVLDISQVTFLTTKRDPAAKINAEKLNNVKHVSIAPTIKNYESTINQWSIYQATKHDPLNHTVEIGIGIPVVFTKNDISGRWKNGNQGTISEVIKDVNTGNVTIVVQKNNGEAVLVNKVKSPIIMNVYNKFLNEIVEKEVGEIEQYPCMTGFAFTIHKAQGLTLDSIVVDTCGGCFAPGQLYVALSRVRRLDDLYLKQPITIDDLKPSGAIEKYYNEFLEKATMV
jgi:ATP-dependent exoDNAse (exonuclease V) alpha subunit